MPDPHFPRERASGLVDVLDRVLDKGLVVAGDVRISLAEVELLTIRLRLIVCSIDKAREIGLDWWTRDATLTSGDKQVSLENETLKQQVRSLERKVASLVARRAATPLHRRNGRRPRVRRPVAGE
ncbi:MAG: gas vesicle protein [Candidatus Rokubacteria bacterium]|nr:gas vesicle protein [Candidatus Rokubacteria bacterium]